MSSRPPPLRHHLRHGANVAWTFTACMLVPAVVLAALGLAGSATALVIAVLLAVFATIPLGVALVYRSNARKADAYLAAFQAGRFLAHWTYPPDDLRRYADNYGRNRRKTTWLATLLSGGLTGAAVGFGMGLAMIESPGTRSLGILVMIAATPAGILLALLIAWPILRVIARRRDEMLAGGVEVFIGESAAYFAGKVMWWNTAYRTLEQVTFAPGTPAKLEIKVHISTGKPGLILDLLTLSVGRPTPGSRSGYDKDVITVPTGCEDEAREVARRLQERVGQ